MLSMRSQFDGMSGERKEGGLKRNIRVVINQKAVIECQSSFKKEINKTKHERTKRRLNATHEVQRPIGSSLVQYLRRRFPTDVPRVLAAKTNQAGTGAADVFTRKEAAVLKITPQYSIQSMQVTGVAQTPLEVCARQAASLLTA